MILLQFKLYLRGNYKADKRKPELPIFKLFESTNKCALKQHVFLKVSTCPVEKKSSKWRSFARKNCVVENTTQDFFPYIYYILQNETDT